MTSTLKRHLHCCRHSCQVRSPWTEAPHCYVKRAVKSLHVEVSIFWNTYSNSEGQQPLITCHVGGNGSWEKSSDFPKATQGVGGRARSQLLPGWVSQLCLMANSHARRRYKSRGGTPGPRSQALQLHSIWSYEDQKLAASKVDEKPTFLKFFY